MWSYYDEFLSYVAKHSKQRKTTKVIKLQWIASIWHQNDLKSWVTSQNYKRNQITMNLIDLTSERSKMLSYAAKLQMWSYYDEFASIWRQNDQECWGTSQNIQNNAKLQMKSNYNERKTFKTTQNYESHQITIFIDLTSERSKMLSYVAKLQMWSYYDEFASIWRQNDNNNSKLRKWSNYNALHQFDVKTI